VLSFFLSFPLFFPSFFPFFSILCLVAKAIDEGREQLAGEYHLLICKLTIIQCTAPEILLETSLFADMMSISQLSAAGSMISNIACSGRTKWERIRIIPAAGGMSNTSKGCKP
jgi:hypothetical protein